MKKEEYSKLTKKILPQKTKIKSIIIAFISGGFVGVIAQLLVDFYSTLGGVSENVASGLMMLTFIFVSSLLTALGVFDKLVTIFGAGLIVPITGFSHSTTSSAMDYKYEGLVNGIGSNIFKLSGSVILYGIVSAYIFGTIRYIIFGG